MQHGPVGKAGDGGFAVLGRVFGKRAGTGQAVDAGASAEAALERVIADLPGSCSALRNVVLPDVGRRIGRVVLTMSGIFTILAEGDKGVVTFDGTQLRLDGRAFDTDFLSQAQADATALKDHLAVAAPGEAYLVEPTIVFSRASVKVQGKAKGVRVIPLKLLTAELIGGGSRMPAEKRERALGALMLLVASRNARRA